MFVEKSKKPAIRKQSRRLKKKLRLDEFQQLGFEVSITLKPDLGMGDPDRFLDEFILDAIENNELAFGGGADCGFITNWKRGSASEAHRTIIENWLSQRQEVVSVAVSPPI
ncbi:MAG: YggL family protein [Gallionellaceae bacterium]